MNLFFLAMIGDILTYSRLIDMLFQKAAEIGKDEPVVIILDEAEQMLGQAAPEGRKMQSLLRECISNIQEENVEVYFFAATNTPEDIDLGDGWSRRLGERIHVQLPGQAGRQALTERAFEKNKVTLSTQEVETVASKLAGFSAHDVNDLARRSSSKHFGRLSQNTSWTEQACDGKLVLKPAQAGDEVFFAGSLRQLSQEDKRRVRIGSPTFQDVLKLIEDGRNRGRWPSMKQAELDKHQRYADSQEH